MDISNIKKENLDLYILTLFTVTIIDLTIYNHFKNFYKEYRKETMYPYFGYIEENKEFKETPKLIFKIPARKGITDLNGLVCQLDEYLQYFIESSENFFKYKNIKIDIRDFIKAMIEDENNKPDENDEGTFYENYITNSKNT